MSEEWKDVPGLEGRYQASNLGQVRSLDRPGRTCYGATRQLKGRIIATKPGKRGYNFIPPNIYKTSLVHRIVAMTFIPNPNNYSVINHIDGNKSNNRVENLEWCTQLHNMQHAFRTGLAKPPPPPGLGQENITAKLNNEQVREIKASLANGERNIDLARRFSVNKSVIANIKSGICWKSVQI